MSLTIALADTKGPVARFFVEHFPEVRLLQQEWRQRMTGVQTARPPEDLRPVNDGIRTRDRTVGHELTYRREVGSAS